MSFREMNKRDLNWLKEALSGAFHSDLNILRDIILYFAKTDPFLSPTRLVKLVYLAELKHIKRVGEPLSGAEFISDNFGPNSREIQLLTDILDGAELEISEGVSTKGRRMRCIRLKADLPPLSLNYEQKVTLEIIRHKWSLKSNDDIIKATKETKPYLATPFKEKIYLDAEDPEQRNFFVEHERILKTEKSYLLQ